MSGIDISVKLDPKETEFVKNVLQQYIKVNKSAIQKMENSGEFVAKAGMIQFIKAEIEQSELLIIRFNLHKNIN